MADDLMQRTCRTF